MWQRLDLYIGDYSISIEKLRKGQNDATRARTAGWDGNGKGFTLHQLWEFTSFLMREIP
jgi:hypothetical protein